MFTKLKEALFGKARPPKDSTFQASGLGELKFNDDVDLWEVELARDGDTFIIGVGENDTPAQALIQHAVDILEDYTAFKKMVMEFIDSEKSKFKGYEDEIGQLTIESVSLWNPQKPNDGMIYFSGPDEFRVWRCDYVAGKPRDLGFDD